MMAIPMILDWMRKKKKQNRYDSAHECMKIMELLSSNEENKENDSEKEINTGYDYFTENKRNDNDNKGVILVKYE